VAGSEALPDSLNYWRGFVQDYLTRLCHSRAAEDGWQGGPEVPADTSAGCAHRCGTAAAGMEFLTRTVMAGLWLALNAEMSGRIAAAAVMRAQSW